MKDDLHRYLRAARESLVWKLDGLGERDLRRPLTRTGTNLLGLVKHMAGVELGYFGDTFGRPYEVLPWMGEVAEENADMWATEAESRDDVVALYRSAWDLANGTIAAHDLDARGRVPWWPGEHGEVTLHRVLVHVVAETNRHAGHADLVRELVDGSAGLRPGMSNLPEGDAAWWESYVARVQAAAESFDET